MKTKVRKCCNFKLIRYRKDYPASDKRAWVEVHARGCIEKPMKG